LPYHDNKTEKIIHESSCKDEIEKEYKEELSIKEKALDDEIDGGRSTLRKQKRKTTKRKTNKRITKKQRKYRKSKK